MIRRLAAGLRGAALLLVGLSPAPGQGAFIDQRQEDVRLIAEIEYRTDVGEDASFESVAAMRDGWISQAAQRFEGTGKPVRLWARFDIPAAKDARRVYILTGSWERVEYFFVRDGRLVQRGLAGTVVPSSERSTDVGMTPPVMVPGFAAIDVPAQPRTRVYAHLTHDNRFVAMEGLRFSLWNEERVREEVLRDGLTQGVFLGAMLLLFVCNLAFYLLEARDATYLYYALTVASGCALWLGMSGLSFAVLWPEHPVWDYYMLSVVLPGGIFVFVQFMRRYLDTKRRLPRLDRDFVRVAGVCIALPPLAQILGSILPNQILGGMLPIADISRTMVVAAPAFGALTAFAVAIVALRERLPAARLFFSGMVCAVAGVLLSALPFLGAPWPQLVHAHQLGMVVMGTILTIGLGLRMRDMRAELAQQQIREARIEAERRQAEIASKHKSDFLANMSHELRTPLNAIIGFSEVMLGGMAGAMPDKQKEFTTDIRESGKHLLALINDILDLSKIEAGRMELDVARFDLPAAMDNAMALVRGRAERHGIRLESRVGAGVGDYEGDERKFKQILVNLLGNAAKFTPEGGTVTLGAERVNGAYVFSVADTGIGIAPADHERIFEEFRQVGTDYARKAEGTGLGLALTRKLVELHGGTIRVASAPGEGSTFTFELPIAGT